MSWTTALASLLTASLLHLSAAGRNGVASRAFCSYTQEEQTFGDGPDQFNVTVAVARGQGSCDEGLQCRPLIRKFSFCRGGTLFEKDIAVAWVCAAEMPSVPGIREDSVRYRRSAGTGPVQHRGVVSGLRRCRGRTDPHNQDTDQEQRRTRWPARYSWWQERRQLLKRVTELKKQLKLKKEAYRGLKKQLKLRRQKGRSRSLKLEEKIRKLRQQKQRRSLLRDN